MPAAVSGVPLGGVLGTGMARAGCPRVSSSLRAPGPRRSGRPGHGSHPTAQVGLIALGSASHDFLAPGPHPGCNCESDFTDGTCEDLTGRCYCRPNFTGEWCDMCAEGFTGFPHCYREGARLGGGGSPGALLSCLADMLCLLPSAMPSHNDTGEQVLPAGQIVSKCLRGPHCPGSHGGNGAGGGHTKAQQRRRISFSSRQF